MKKLVKNSKLVLSSLALVLLLCSVVNGSLALLIDKTDPVVNTFTYGDINIELHESDTKDGDENDNTNSYQMMPGMEIAKNPLVTVKANSENAWLFVKLEKSENLDTFIEYQIADGWTALDGVEGVYYREVEKAQTDAQYYVIKGNKVLVKEDVTKEMLNQLDAGEAANYPTLTVTAYAVQRDATINTAKKAWIAILENQPQNP